MKIVKTITKEYEFFPDQERQRLAKNFAGDQLQRQLDILDAFLEKNVEKVHELYDALPYDPDGGCPEQEYIGWWYNVIFYNEYPFHQKSIKLVNEEKELKFE